MLDSDSLFDWDKTEMHLFKYNNNIEKLEYLLTVRDKCTLLRYGYGIRSQNNEFLTKCDIEIARLNRWIDFEQKKTALAQESKLPEIKSEETEESTIVTPTTKIIADYINSIDKNQGWEYAFIKESDYNIFLNLLTCYFEHRPYSLPKETIQLNKNCKTRFAPVLRPIHKKLTQKQLKSDYDFFAIIKILSPFNKMTDTEIYKAITR